MPRVHTKMARPSTKDRQCSKGDGPIIPGERYHTWSFRYGGTYYRHERCGYPPQSQLTQSKMSGVYAAQEDARTALDVLSDPKTADEDAQAILEELAGVVTDVANEYQESAEAMGAAGEEMESKADELEAYADELNNWDATATKPDEDEDDDMDWEDENGASTWRMSREKRAT